MEELKMYIKSFSQKQNLVAYFFMAFIVLGSIYIFMHSPPSNFPLGSVVTINSGDSLQSITTDLYNAHIIRSPFFFRFHVIMQGGEKKVMAGDYLLDHAEGSADLAYRLVHGQFHLPTVKITIPEGWNVFQIGDYLKNNLINFDKVQFLSLAKKEEGYLFPDTYFVSPTTKPSAIVDMMKKTFGEKIQTVPGIATSTHPLKDIIIIASILENEARTTENRRIIAGILWKRLTLGMPLQVDSTFSYINGKTSDELTLDDLKINSPYNTYIYTGLPPGPIGNPGLDSINDAINFVKTKYLYFLSSKDGTKIYYATTFDEHIKNKQLYLNK